MSRQSFEDWIPEEWGGPVISRINQVSSVEAYARVEPMGTDTKHVPRSGGMSFVGATAKGIAYSEDGATNDDVLLTARKIGKVLRVADEDLKDTSRVANIIQTKQLDWARSYAVGFDNACLGVTAVENGTTIPFTSLYKALRTDNADTGYGSDDNYTASTTGGVLTYGQLSTVMGKVEVGNYWADGDMRVVAHPAFRAALRGLVDGEQRPIFTENQSLGTGMGDSLFGIPVSWSLGAKTNAVASDAPTGNPLLFVGNMQYLIKGDRSGPEYMLAGADSGPAFLTDEALLKVRTRRGFAVAHEGAWSVLELVA